MQANNMKAMREALSEIVLLTVKAGKSISCDVACGIIASKAKHALKHPSRNCDVGTEQEQQDRFREFCRHYENEGECGIGRSEAACPAFQGGRNPDCSLWWAQMPYEATEGGAK